MTTVARAQPGRVSSLRSAAGALSGWLRSAENMALTLVLLGMVTLPLLEAVLRKTLHTGIIGVTLIVQHLGLLVGMIGGAIAARDCRLLALFTVKESVLPPRLRPAAHLVTGTVTTVVTALL